MTTHVAACHCGQLELTCQGEPLAVTLCHCTLCQRRTGTAYNLGARYEAKCVVTTGEERTYQRDGERHFDFTFHFCPNCGSNVYWESPKVEGLVIVAVGCFAETAFQKPTNVIYNRTKFDWVQNPEGVNCFETHSG